VPVETSNLNIQGRPWSQTALAGHKKQAQEPENTHSHVSAVKPGEGKEGGAKQVGVNLQPFRSELVELKDLKADEYGTQKGGSQQP
jgi:hypothetical protein